MSRLVEDLLVLARLDGPLPRAHGEVDLDEVVHAEVDALRRPGRLTIVVAPLPALRVRGQAEPVTAAGARLAPGHRPR